VLPLLSLGVLAAVQEAGLGRVGMSSHPIVKSDYNRRLLCPECKSSDLEAYLPIRRHQVTFRCGDCSLLSYLPVGGGANASNTEFYGELCVKSPPTAKVDGQ
jgi:hypothetical protein